MKSDCIITLSTKENENDSQQSANEPAFDDLGTELFDLSVFLNQKLYELLL